MMAAIGGEADISVHLPEWPLLIRKRHGEPHLQPARMGGLAFDPMLGTLPGMTTDLALALRVLDAWRPALNLAGTTKIPQINRRIPVDPGNVACG